VGIVKKHHGKHVRATNKDNQEPLFGFAKKIVNIFALSVHRCYTSITKLQQKMTGCQKNKWPQNNKTTLETLNT